MQNSDLDPFSNDHLSMPPMHHGGSVIRDMDIVQPLVWDEDGPEFLKSVAPAELADVTRQVHGLWKVLHRKVRLGAQHHLRGKGNTPPNPVSMGSGPCLDPRCPTPNCTAGVPISP